MRRGRLRPRRCAGEGLRSAGRPSSNGVGRGLAQVRGSLGGAAIGAFGPTLAVVRRSDPDPSGPNSPIAPPLTFEDPHAPPAPLTPPPPAVPSAAARAEARPRRVANQVEPGLACRSGPCRRCGQSGAASRHRPVRSGLRHDQEPVALADSLCVDGKGWLVIALAAREERHRKLQGLVLLHHPSPAGRLDEAHPNHSRMIFAWPIARRCAALSLPSSPHPTETHFRLRPEVGATGTTSIPCPHDSRSGLRRRRVPRGRDS